MTSVGCVCLVLEWRGVSTSGVSSSGMERCVW